LHDDIRIRIRILSRILTSDKWIRIREAQKHVDPVDPNPDSDPEHCFEATKKGKTIFPLLLCCCWIQDPGWIKVKGRIRDYHPYPPTLRITPQKRALCFRKETKNTPQNEH
jgi:hypothetical protein